MARGLHRDGEGERAALRKAAERLSAALGTAEEARRAAELQLLAQREETERLRAEVRERERRSKREASLKSPDRI